MRNQAIVLAVTATTCVAALKTLIETAAELAGDKADADGQGAGATLSAALARINGAGDVTERDVAALTTQGEAVLSLLTGSPQRLEFQNEVGDTLDSVGKELAQLAAGATACGDDIQAPLAALFAKLAAIYTMVQERDVQAMIAARRGISVAQIETPVIADTAGADFEDALF